MSVPIHATPKVRKAIYAACAEGNVAPSGETQRFMIANGVALDALLACVQQHLNERREVHAKFHDDGTHSYHGSLLLDSTSVETVYFEVKLGSELIEKLGTHVVGPGGIWLQVKPHQEGRRPLSREVK